MALSSATRTVTESEEARRSPGSAEVAVGDDMVFNASLSLIGQFTVALMAKLLGDASLRSVSRLASFLNETPLRSLLLCQSQGFEPEVSVMALTASARLTHSGGDGVAARAFAKRPLARPSLLAVSRLL